MTKQKQDPTPTLQELMAQMARMQAELDSLRQRAQTLPQPVSQPKAEVSTSRRKLLRQLAGGLVAGLAVAGVGITNPNRAEAKLSSNPSGNGLTGRVGMLVMPPGASVSGTMGGVSGTKVGLLVSGDSSFNITSAIAPTVNSAIIGYTSNNGSAIAGISQTGIAVYGQSDSNDGICGVSTSGYGVFGATYSTSLSSPDYTAGVYGSADGTNKAGVRGTGNNGFGVYGESTNWIGVLGTTTSNGYAAIYGQTDGTVPAGKFLGPVEVFGHLGKSSGSFKIDHPLDPANKYLYHSFVESPDMMNIYNGIVTLDEQGEATVEMPDWFEALNSDFRYQLTSIGASMPDLFIAEELTNRQFKIAGGKAGQKVSWMVTGIRHDEWAKTHRIPVEEVKSGDEKGKYLHPELFGQPEEMSVHPRPVMAK